MAVYEYRGVEIKSGKAAKGVRDAESPKALRALLRRDGVLLTEASEGKEKKNTKGRREVDFMAFFKRVSTSEIAILTRQLATLVRAGVPLVESLTALMDQVENEILVRILGEVRDSVNQGTPFSKSLAVHPKVFPPLYVNMVAAGEASGSLEAVLERLADFTENQSRLKGKVFAALMYPALMSVVGFGVVTLLMVTVVPKVTAIFDSLDQELPIYTRALIFMSNTISDYWWLLLGGIGAGVYGFIRWIATESGRRRFDLFKLRAPVFGRLNLLVGVARFARTLSTLLASGVPILRAMEIGSNVLENAMLQAAVASAIGSIREGESIAEPLKRSELFPPMVTHMIAIGERTGRLEEMLENVARAYESDVDTKVTALTSLLEPLMIVGLGLSVGFIVISIMVPLMQMNQAVQ